MKVVNETRKILHLSDDVKISCTAGKGSCAYKPFRGSKHRVRGEITPEKARKSSNAYGVEVMDDPATQNIQHRYMQQAKTPFMSAG